MRLTGMKWAVLVTALATARAAHGAAGVVTVAKSGGDYTDPIAAVQSIVDAGPANPYVVRVRPGIYDLGSATLQMKPYVDVEGSGQGVTVFRGSFSTWGDLDNDGAVVEVVAGSELRNLTVENVGSSEGQATAVRASGGFITFVTARATGTGSSYVNAIVTYQGAPRIAHVTAIASGGGQGNGIKNRTNSTAIITDSAVSGSGWAGKGILNSEDAVAPGPTVSNSSIVAQGPLGGNVTGIENYRSFSAIRNTTVQTLGALTQFGIFVFNWDSTRAVTLESSSVVSGDRAIVNAANAPFLSLSIANTLLSGTIENSSLMKCTGTYGPAFDPVSCP